MLGLFPMSLMIKILFQALKFNLFNKIMDKWAFRVIQMGSVRYPQIP